MIKTTIPKNDEKALLIKSHFNQFAAVSVIPKPDSNIKLIEKSLEISMIKIPAKPALKPRNSNRQLSPFKLTNDEDELEHGRKTILQDLGEFHIKLKTDCEDFHTFKTIKKKGNMILSYLKQRSDNFIYFADSEEEKMSCSFQEFNNKKRFLSYAKAKFNFNNEYSQFRNHRICKISSSKCMSDLCSFSSRRVKKSHTAKNLDCLKRRIDSFKISFTQREV